MKFKHLKPLIAISTLLCITFNAVLLSSYVDALGSPRDVALLPLLGAIVLILALTTLFIRIGWV